MYLYCKEYFCLGSSQKLGLVAFATGTEINFFNFFFFFIGWQRFEIYTPCEAMCEEIFQYTESDQHHTIDYDSLAKGQPSKCTKSLHRILCWKCFCCYWMGPSNAPSFYHHCHFSMFSTETGKICS